MVSVEQRGGQPEQKPVNRERREFLKGVAAGAAVIYFGNDFLNNTDLELSKVEYEAREELKVQGVLPPSEQQMQAELHNDTSLGIAKNTNTTLPPKEREQLRKEAKDAALRDYNIQHSKLMWKKAPLLQIRAYVDFAGVIGGGAMILKKLFEKAKNR